MNYFETPFGNFQLERLPIRHNESLKAWDAADEKLVKELGKSIYVDKFTKILIVNDTFGALSCCLNSHQISHWGDSYLAHKALKHNLMLNGIVSNLKMFTSIQRPNDCYSLILIKIPKTLSLLEEQLITLKSCINENTEIIAASMIKYLHTSHFKLFEKYLGTTTTSLAEKKARLLFIKPEKLSIKNVSPYPSQYYQADFDLNISNHANVFSREKLDIGTRFMIEQFAQIPKAEKIIDLGCGNGILGIMAKHYQHQLYSLDSDIHFVDESYMAIDSSCTNYRLAFDHDASQDSSAFHISNGLDDIPEEAGIIGKTDLILCNPPFHQNNVVGDHIALDMFKQSKYSLQKNGQLWVVGNRHLQYYKQISQIFGNCQTIASNKKFVVLSAIKK